MLSIKTALSSQDLALRHAISPTFFHRPTLVVAEDLLGTILARRRRGTIQRGIITEVEAYDGPEDRASHAHRGKTARNAPMFGHAGHWYVYLVYGMHWMLNIVTGAEGYPAAVLMRGVMEISLSPRLSAVALAKVEERVRVRGPGKLTRAFGIDKTFNAQPALEASGLWIEDHGIAVPRSVIRRVPRIGVDYAGAVWTRKPYRFILEINEI